MLLHFSKSIEECTEMFGMTLLWMVFLHHLAWLAGDLHVRFDPVRPLRATSSHRRAPVAAKASSGDPLTASELPKAA